MHRVPQDARLAAILGPTNTGKTHYAIERMLGHTDGVIGLPLRLLAREVYDKITEAKGYGAAALITGEEKIIPEYARYYVCTVEAMPTDRRFSFAAIDEIQLARDPERGHVFTDRLLNMRGRHETLFLGAETIKPIIRKLVPDAEHITRERYSTLTYAGPKKLSRLPKRSVIVAFSKDGVYALAEYMRRQHGGAAVVMGALSPRTRNAQAELYQSGEVDYLIATDAVGMGLNLDTKHVAFADIRKFDGRRRRALMSHETAQIAGRAGRFRQDGTFGTTADCPEMDAEMVYKIENHQFSPARFIEWRNASLSFNTVKELQESLALPSDNPLLRRVRRAVDERVLERLCEDGAILDTLTTPGDVRLLWDVCQIPDFRSVTIDAHVRLLGEIYSQLRAGHGQLSNAWIGSRLKRFDHAAGDVDAISARIAHVRTWTYLANRAGWMNDVETWRARTRAIEDNLSDALHRSLITRFVDQRTSALMRSLKGRTRMEATVSLSGEVKVDGHHVGRLEGLRFVPDSSARGLEAKAVRNAALNALQPQIEFRMDKLIKSAHESFALNDDGEILWEGQRVGEITAGNTALDPKANPYGGEMASPKLMDAFIGRLEQFLKFEIETLLAPLVKLKAALETDAVEGLAKGMGYRLVENLGALKREDHDADIRAIESANRRQLREQGARFGEYSLFMPDLIKPKPARLISILYAFGPDGKGRPFLPPAGFTSVKLDKSHIFDQVMAAGFRPAGPYAIRLDMLERLANTIRDARAIGEKGIFQIQPHMLAIMGCTFEEIREILMALGFKHQKIKPRDPFINPPPARPKTESPPKTETPPKTAEPATEDLNEATSANPDAKTGEDAAPDTAQKEAEPAEPLHDALEVWFTPARRKNRQQGRPQQNNRGKAGAKKSVHTGKGKPKPGRAAKKEKPIDPDSPFAALAQLKLDKDKPKS